VIAKLAGLIDSIGDNACVIDVGGVGYQVFCSARTLRALPRPGAAAKLLIETHVREDHIHLYGFATDTERRWFLALQTVQGVASRIALSLLSTLSPGELAQAIAAGDKAMLTQAPGVGGKLATRLITELKDKIAQLPGFAIIETASGDGQTGDKLAADAVSALVNLGYRRVEAVDAVRQAARVLGANAGLPALIRSGLKELGR
jgi:Holliday junction DNA helicase RuvA